MLSVTGENHGKKVSFINCSFSLAYIGAWCLYIISFGYKDYREKVQRLCEPRVFPNDDVQRAFEYNPRTFRIGIIDEVKEYLSKKTAKYY